MEDFKRAIAEVATRAGVPATDALAAVTVPRERDRADLTLPCFTFAKAAGKAPPVVAADVAAAFTANDLLDSAEAAGPFVNFRVNRGTFAQKLLGQVDEDYGRSDAGSGKTIVIDYGSPNIAKPLLFHHLRSTVIGQALCNLLRWQGYEVIGLNFLGDVGTAFGKLMVGIEDYGEAQDAGALNDTYIKASAACAADPARMERARAWAKRLEDDDAEAKRLWEQVRSISIEGFRHVYDWLGVRHDVVDGEQMYVKPAAALIDRLLKEGRVRESDGAVVLDAEDKKLGVLLLRKSDGATLYQTRDLAAAIDRYERFRFDRMLYIVDIAQEHHFKQLFSGLQKLGYEWADRLRHVAFGQVLMAGRRTATREGRGILLDDVLREGERRALEITEDKNADLQDQEAIAHDVGVAAVIFSDLGYPVRKNINFEWDEVLSFDGRTGPYLQYVHASAASILRKGGESGAGDPTKLTHELEWNLVRRLAEFPDAARRAGDDCEPSILSNCVYDLAREFRAYHSAGGRDASLRVLVDDQELRAARLELVHAIKCTLAVGLRLLGIRPLEQM